MLIATRLRPKCLASYNASSARLRSVARLGMLGLALAIPMLTVTARVSGPMIGQHFCIWRSSRSAAIKAAASFVSGNNRGIPRLQFWLLCRTRAWSAADVGDGFQDIVASVMAEAVVD